MKVLISPLDWGLGHATRVSCLVRNMLDEGHSVILAGSGMSLKMLKGDFPQLETVKLRSFSPWFFRRLPQWIAITLQVPKFVMYYMYEKYRTRKIVKRYGVDMIISDNRYGVRAKGCKNVIVTHQLSPIMATWAPEWMNRMLAKSLAHWLNEFDEVWVPDIKPYPNGLAGRLADPRYVETEVKTVGLLSRLSRLYVVAGRRAGQGNRPIDHLAIVSGPEPQRSVMEEKVRKQFDELGGRNVVLDGKHYTSPDVMSALISGAGSIYCRSGYSTIMDLVHLGRTATLTPTPGQAEQEYLCDRMLDYGFIKDVEEDK